MHAAAAASGGQLASRQLRLLASGKGKGGHQPDSYFGYYAHFTQPNATFFMQTFSDFWLWRDKYNIEHIVYFIPCHTVSCTECGKTRLAFRLAQLTSQLGAPLNLDISVQNTSLLLQNIVCVSFVQLFSLHNSLHDVKDDSSYQDTYLGQYRSMFHPTQQQKRIVVVVPCLYFIFSIRTSVLVLVAYCWVVQGWRMSIFNTGSRQEGKLHILAVTAICSLVRTFLRENLYLDIQLGIHIYSQKVERKQNIKRFMHFTLQSFPFLILQPIAIVL